MPRTYPTRRRTYTRRRRRLIPVAPAMSAIAKSTVESAVANALAKTAGKTYTKKLSQTRAPTRGARGIKPFRANLRSTRNFRRYPTTRPVGKGGLYMGGKTRYPMSVYTPLGLNSGHRHKFKSDIKGHIIPMSHHKGKVILPLKKYQKLELRFFQHPVTQKVLWWGNQSVLPSSDNLLSNKVDFEKFVEVDNKDYLSMSYFPISNCANFSGVHSWIRHDVASNSESFSKVSVLGRQNRCPTENKSVFDNTYVMSNKDAYFAEQETILRNINFKAQIQATKNFPIKITVSLVRAKQPGQFVTNTGLPSNELIEFTNVQNHIDYDAGSYIFSQSKILQPVSKNKVVSQSFDINANLYYKLTKKFRDETANTLQADQTGAGVTYKYGQQMKSKIAGVSGTDMSNRLYIIIKAKRLGDTQLATIKRGIFENSTQTTNSALVEQSVEQNVNAPDTDINGGLLATGINSLLAENMNTAGFRIKSEINITYMTKEATREIPTWTSGTNAGKTRILNASIHDSDYGTLNTGYNVT